VLFPVPERSRFDCRQVWLQWQIATNWGKSGSSTLGTGGTRMWKSSNAAVRRRQAPSQPQTNRHSRLAIEALEDRTVLSLDPLGSVTGIVGPSTSIEGSLYTLALQAVPSDPITGWTIDWGDGTVDELAGAATSASHVYADGPGGFVIQATVRREFDWQGTQWAEADGGNGHFYGLTGAAVNWSEAEAEAAALGGHLASIANLQEQQFLNATFLAGADASRVLWIGLNDAQSEGQFVWSSGEAVTFQNWNSGEPNNYLGVEDYVTINWQLANGRADGVLGDWNDVPLAGVNGALNGPEPYFGIIELAGLPADEEFTHSLAVSVDNAAPTAAVDGPAAGVRGQSLTFAVHADDASPIDAAAGLNYSVDWDRDGHIDESFVGGQDVELRHTFTAAGDFAVQIVVTDKDGGGAALEHSVRVTVVTLETDPDTGGTTLMVGGSTGDDWILLTPVCYSSKVAVFMNGRFLGKFRPSAGATVFGQAGNDVIVAAALRLPTLLDGGAGNDWLWGGRDNDLLFGGEGDDWLFGGSGNDVLVGGAGNDHLAGGCGRDLLIGGSGRDALWGGPDADLLIGDATLFDDNPVALDALRDEWAARRDRTTRVRNLTDGSGSAERHNGNFFLVRGVTVLDDAAVDHLFSHNRSDWLFPDLLS
jgi:Ca2+-binding RTX toxin-like protein